MTGAIWRGPIRAALAVLALALPGVLDAQTAPEFAELQAAAETGSAEAQFALAEIYRRGLERPQDFAAAAEWYAAAAAQDHPAAQNALAGLHVEGLGVDADPARAFELFTAAAQSGEPAFLHDLALVHEFGIGTDPDPARAAELFAQAADLGWMPSIVALGVMYQSGTGVEQDIPRALDLYLAAAEAGYAQAQNNLALIYSRGEGGVEQDYAKALEWLTKAASQGSPEALRNLAVMYENGFGVEPDEDEARRLNRLAALQPGQQADAEGDAAGVQLVFDARLAKPDPALADSYLLAAESGDPVGLFLVGYLQATGATSAMEYRAAARLFERAADKGMSAAMVNLGLMMFAGRGVLQDYVEGYKWLSMAVVGGFPGAAELRDGLAARMTPAQINSANAAAQAAWAGGAAPPD